MIPVFERSEGMSDVDSDAARVAASESNSDGLSVIHCLPRGDFETPQEGQLLNVIAVRQPIVAENVAVVPEFLNELVRLIQFN